MPVSRITFGTTDYAWGIAVVSLTVLFDNVAAGQKALLQGLRRLGDLAKCTLYGALAGTVVSVLPLYFMRERGIVFYIVAVSVFGALASWWYARRIETPPGRMNLRGMKSEVAELLKLGFALMFASLLTVGCTYLIRILIVRTLDMRAVGLYTATATLSSIYVGTVLGAMGADFYPRLTGLAKNHPAMNRLVNEQTEMGILMALPGVLATLVLAPLVLRIFYSAEFVPAAAIIRWQILGVVLRIVSWPMGYVILAKGMSRLFMLTEFLTNALQIGLVLVCMHIWGLVGLGVSFFLMYAGYTLLMLVVCRRVTGLAWSRRTGVLVLASTAFILTVLLGLYFLNGTWGVIMGLLLTAISVALCFKQLQESMNIDLMRIARRILLRRRRGAPPSL
jgi:PST family polysaccharide transporter